MKKTVKKTIKKTGKELTVQELLKLHNTDMKRYVGSLSEDFQGRVRAIGEQFSGLNRKLDAHDEQFKVVHLTLGSIKEDLEVMKEDLAIIKFDVKKRVTYDDLTTLTKRVLLLEKKAHR